MKGKKRFLFLCSLLTPVISWGLGHLIGFGHDTSSLFWSFEIGAFLTFFLIPLAFRRIFNMKPHHGGLNFLFMMIPIIITISHPSTCITPGITLFYDRGLTNVSLWLIGSVTNSVIFFLAAYLFLKFSNHKRPGWNGIILTTAIIVLFYAVSLYFSSLIYDSRFFNVL